MSRLRILLAVLALAVGLAVTIAACGGDDDESTDEDPQAVLDETFSNEETASSGNLSLNVSVSAEGEQGGSFDASLSGPVQGDPENPNALPRLDLTASASGEGGGQSIDFDGGLVITEDNAYVEYGGETYEVGTEQFGQLRDAFEAQNESAQGEDGAASFRAGCEQAIEQAGGDPASCDIDFAGWLTNLTNEGTEEVGGAETVHVSGDADVEQILGDIGKLAATIPGAAAQGFDPSQLGTYADVVSEASIDVFSGVDDRLLRGLDASLAIDPTALGVPVPVESVNLSFSLELADVNEEQTIEAPEGDVRPIEDLTGGIPFDLGGLPGGGGLPGAGGGGGAKKAAECLENAGSDPAAIEKCLS